MSKLSAWVSIVVPERGGPPRLAGGAPAASRTGKAVCGLVVRSAAAVPLAALVGAGSLILGLQTLTLGDGADHAEAQPERRPQHRESEKIQQHVERGIRLVTEQLHQAQEQGRAQNGEHQAVKSICPGGGAQADAQRALAQPRQNVHQVARQGRDQPVPVAHGTGTCGTAAPAKTAGGWLAAATRRSPPPD